MNNQLQKILHVDDDPVMRMMTKKALERARMGFDVVSCASAHELIDQLSQFGPDLLLVDMIMPIMDGLSLVAHIRSLSTPLAQTPVIFITGRTDTNINGREKLEPILGIIHKPFSPTTLGSDLVDLWNVWAKEM
ncbi:MAG: response regulator [Pseudobdellovibrionaceae bacterium]